MRTIKHPSLPAMILLLLFILGVPRLPAQYLVTTNLFPVADATIRQDTPTLNYGRPPPSPPDSAATATP